MVPHRCHVNGVVKSGAIIISSSSSYSFSSSKINAQALVYLALQHVGEFNYPRLADFGAAISGANKFQCQQVLEELDVSYS